MNEEQALQEALAAALGAHFAGETVRDVGALCTSAEHARVARAIGDLAAMDFKRVRIAAQTAFWLNVFNAVVVRDLAERAQADSVRDVESF
ncbi:MAG TPA: hypothetical protein VNU64_03775, partial [Burkholderiales bacterium]|nr:hypothetical protein [Burkholderiales bacterium]